jgi:hypothetical protein
MQDCLDFETLEFPSIDAEGIVSRKVEREIMKVVELVLATAVQCDEKSSYIEQIMAMGQEHQAELMVTIDRVMNRLNGGRDDDQPPASAAASGDVVFDSEMSATLSRENQALKQARPSIIVHNDSLRIRVDMHVWLH